MKTLNRREFIRLATLMGGVSLFAGCTLFEERAAVPEYIKGAPGVDPLETLPGIKNIYSVCNLCPGNCGICCRVSEAALVKIGGNPYHPVSARDPLRFGTPLKDAAVAGGSICAVGGSGIQTLYNPFRVARPLKRVGPRGSGKWKALSWKEAIEEIVRGGDLFGEGNVQGLKAIKDYQAGLSFLVGRADWGALTFIKRFLGGFPRAELVRDRSVLLSNVGIDAAAAVFGPGTGPVDADYRNARFLLSFGDAPLDSGIPLVSIARDLADARVNGSGLRWAVVDPKLSTSGSKADLWVPIIPGTDVNLALAIARALVENFPSALKVSRDAVAKLLSGGTVAEYATACGIAPVIPVRLAEMLAEAGPLAAVTAGRGIYSQQGGLEATKAVLSLNLMVGSTPGSGGLIGRTDPFLAQAEKTLLGGAQKDWRAVGLGAGGKALILWESDPVYEESSAVADLLKDREKVPLFVAVESQITETAALADYILPDTTYLERWDICVSPPSVTRPGVGVRVPVVGGFEAKTGRYFPLLPETRPMEEILIDLAAAVGQPGFGGEAPGGIKNAWDFFQRAVTAVADGLKQEGFPIPAPDIAAQEIMARGGYFAEKKTKTAAATPSPNVQVIEPPIPALRPEKKPTGDGFDLITYTLPFHRSPRSGLNSWLLEVWPENRLLINAIDARKLGIRTNDQVVVESRDAKNRKNCRALVIPGIRPGVVALAGGFGYTQAGASAEIIDGVATQADKQRGAGVNPVRFAEGRGPVRVNVKKA